MPNVVKGGDMRGLIRYLAGPGKANEHDNPHVVGGDVHLVAWHGAEQLDMAAANEIADYLDRPRQHFDVEMRAQVTALDPETERKTVVGYRDQHVWHCSLSLPAEEGVLDEDRWQQIAGDFMDRMGFAEAGSGKAACRWVAIHHGPSAKGNDHIHIAASMVREDGTKWDGQWLDYKRAQEACRDLEQTHGLRAVAGREAGLSVRGEKVAERAAADRAGMGNTAPVELAHRVRSAAVASTSEAEWIRRVRSAGVVVKPYYAKGTTDVVTGYKAALKPEEYSGKLVFYGGGRLGKDLSLPRIREGFEAPTVEQASAAAAEWDAAAKGRPPVDHGREQRQVQPEASVRAAKALGEFNDRLAGIPVGDDRAWADLARDTAGALSAWARFDTANRDELNAAARHLARSAQVRRPGRPHRRAQASTMGAAVVLLQSRTDGKGAVAGTLLARQLFTTATALRDRQAAIGQLAEARATHTDVLERLSRIPLTGYGTETSAVEAAHEEREVAAATAISSALDGSQGPRRDQGHDGRGTAEVDGPLPRRLPEPKRTHQRDDGHGR